MRLQGKNAMITGGARGQGAAEARAFIKAGAKVLITDVEEKDGTALAKELGENAFFLKHDVAEDKDWLAAIKQAKDKLGGLDVLVNNAGIYEPGSIADTSVEDFERQVRINQLGTFLGMKHAAPVMGKGGSIINISSVAGMEGFSGCLRLCRDQVGGARDDQDRRQGVRRAGHPGQFDPSRFHRH